MPPRAPITAAAHFFSCLLPERPISHGKDVRLGQLVSQGFRTGVLVAASDAAPASPPFLYVLPKTMYASEGHYHAQFLLLRKQTRYLCHNMHASIFRSNLDPQRYFFCCYLLIGGQVGTTAVVPPHEGGPFVSPRASCAAQNDVSGIFGTKQRKVRLLLLDRCDWDPGQKSG